MIKKTKIVIVLSAVIIAISETAYSATLNNGDALSIDPGITEITSTDPTYGEVQTNVSSGSYFSMDYNGDSNVQETEKSAIPGTGTTGIIIGQATTAGAHHGGSPLPSDTNAIDAPWKFNTATGSHWTSVGITGGTTNGLNFSGWTWAWNTLSAVPMDSGAWQVGNCADLGCSDTFLDGVANFSWSGIYGDVYTLDYTAAIPNGDPSGLGGIQYYLHLEGVVAKVVPVPAAAWLFGSGLVSIVGLAGRRKKYANR